MRRIWNSWTYYGDSDSGRSDLDNDNVCQESWRSNGGEAEPTGRGILEDAYERSLQRSIGDALERAMDLSDVRNERVVRIKRAIDNGTYHVSARELAQRLIRNMRGDYH
jgi:anti-sigma28 factor (negative regulator of flagellin synthesis)